MSFKSMWGFDPEEAFNAQPDALKDEAFWGRLAEILREIGPSDEELDTIRKRLVAQLNRVQRTHCSQGGFGSSEQ